MFNMTDCRYLLKHGANVAAVNNDGDLAIDIAEDEEMENLLQEEMDKKGILIIFTTPLFVCFCLFYIQYNQLEVAIERKGQLRIQL